ncbi:aldehyde dehydrogenase family protein [Paractinoplanes lichenicola]|uniref:Aldehyde dehydrogenase family protein n=1 Tax=Paractinoplanes lichenicola TaxID=2802976 RepID=A0ABS1VY92_9ACTN|nr:aldehyde dehydrogenase family protein [Actinoplanes lichenicola]MBL7259471.1 aldehyde dehydrogenase family protein [Actinoplanes lichenicola]
MTIVNEIREAATAVRIGAHRSDGPAVPVLDPRTGTAFTEVRTGNRADAEAALAVAGNALPLWSATAPAGRSAALRAIAADVEALAKEPEWPALITQETGKRLAEATAELGLTVAYFRIMADLLDRQQTERFDVVPGIAHRVSVRPAGIAAVLTPWNFPVSIPARKIAPALAAGCPVLFKPSELTPLSSMVLAAVVERHVPDGVLSTVLGTPQDVADPWLAAKEVGVVSFTGSTRVGRLIAASTAPRFVRTVMELGGCAPFIVLPDADPQAAAQTLLVAKYRNNGQSCIAANQILVAREVATEFTEAFAAATEKLVVGDPTDPATDLGPLAPAGDPARMAALVEDAVSRGARVVSSGKVPGEGHYAPATVLLDAPVGSRVLTEEIFGPIAPIHVYDRLDDALALHHSTGYGLAGYVCGADLDNAQAVADRLSAGIVGINNGTPNTPWIPFGGLGDSGLGYEGGRPGLEAFQTFLSVGAKPQGA